MPRIFWPVLAATVALWLCMNLWSAPRIEAIAGGLRLLDMRFTGYSYAEVEAFVKAMGQEGTALYFRWQLWLDTIFPPLLGALIYFVFRWLYPSLPALLIGVIALAYVASDLLENLAVAALLRAGTSGLTPEMAATANQWTQIKWGLALIGLVMLLLGLVLRLRPKF